MKTGVPHLKIYTHVATPEQVESQQAERIKLNFARPFQRRVKRAAEKPAPKPSPAIHCKRPTMTVMDKLMRNSAVACALLLMVLALQNANQPWTRDATQTLKQALTMRIDLDESLGRLNFVRGLVPDTALVFWDMKGNQLQPPADGAVVHEYSGIQPWIEFACTPQQRVGAAQTGTVAAVMQNAEGDWTVLIDHADGVQTVYAYLAQALTRPGDAVERGAQIGVTADAEGSRLYFELRKHGVPQDPALAL